MKKDKTQLSLNEVGEFIDAMPPSEQYLFIHLMKMSLMEIKQYEAAMLEKFNNQLPAEVMKEISANIRKHQQDFGDDGIWRKLFLRKM